MALVVALAVTITVLVVRPDSNDPSATPPDGDSEFASANDTGPVSIITEDPTCDAWGTIAREYAQAGQSVGWADRDQSIPATAWSPEQRAMYDTVKTALSKASDRTEGLIVQTPHRVMRELYEQFVAYSRKLTEAIPDYQERDRHLAGTTDGLGSSLAAICSSIDYESAQRLAPLVRRAEPPTNIASVDDMGSPKPFLSSGSPVCNEWNEMTLKANDATAAWRAIDPAIPATNWTPEQRSINDSVIGTMENLAKQYEDLSSESDNPTFQDLGTLAAQYQRAFIEAIPTYTPNDNYISNAATYIAASILAGCKAANA